MTCLRRSDESGDVSNNSEATATETATVVSSNRKTATEGACGTQSQTAAED